MASYTAIQLRNTGTTGENLSGLKTFTFTNPSSSAYFTMGNYPNATGSFAGTATNFIGTYVASASMGLVTSSYVASVVVQPGVSTFTFTPLLSVVGTDINFRGTGEFSLVVT